MKLSEARKYLKRALRSGYVEVYGGIVGNGNGNYAINIDGDGQDGRLFGCPRLIWCADQAEDDFPTRKRSEKIQKIEA